MPPMAAFWSRSIRAISGRPRSIRCLATPARRATSSGWHHKTTFDALVKEMVEADLIAVRDEQKRRHRDE